MSSHPFPPSKRAKLEPEGRLSKKGSNGSNHSDDNDEAHTLEELAETAWMHYRNYVDSCEANEVGEGDTDELEEMLTEVLEPHFSDMEPLRSLKDAQMATCQVTALLPVLISVAYYHLADCAISECLELQETKDEKVVQEKQELIKKCQDLMEKSLHWYPENAAMWSMGANFGRMFQLISSTTVCQWYEKAVKCASQVRSVALEILEDETILPLVKEWTESLLLNHVAGVEYIVDDDEEDPDEDPDEDEEAVEADAKRHAKNAANGTKRKHKDRMAEEDLDNNKDEEDEGYFSASAVEGTARFMAAMLHSTAGRHGLASDHLKHFPVTHRLHPNVWQPDHVHVETSSLGQGKRHVIKYQGKADGAGILPPGIYKRLCKVFAPAAPYWNESDYNHRGYYSFYIDIPPAIKRGGNVHNNNYAAPNVIEDVIWNHLYPLVQEQMNANKDIKQDDTTIFGAEWWVHTRPIQANLGHNLHFDTDEALLTQEGTITHPIYSSVLYLTGGSTDADGGGATVVLDQTPDSHEVASQAWRCVPQDNSFLIFPGKMLHGVLPCPGADNDRHEDEDDYQAISVMDKDENVSDSIRKHWVPLKTQQSGQVPNHRLTFMVGFWTRRVPDKMKHRKLYGPCGPMPPRPSCENDEKDTQQHTWVNEIAEGYDISRDDSKAKDEYRSDLQAIGVPVVTPAWETLKTSVENEAACLQMPKAIDHRFFVNGAPKCFRDSLFERTENDDDDEDDNDDIGEEDSN